MSDIRYQCFEDYEIGQKGITDARTVGEADIASFAHIAEDYNTPHLNRHFMASSIYGDTVAHGLLGSSLAVGMLSYVAPHIIGRGIPGAYLYNTEFNYRTGMKLGDTMETHWCISEKNDDEVHPGFGIVKTSYQMLNQAGLLIYDGILNTVVRKKANDDVELKPQAQVSPHEVIEFIAEPGRIYYAEDYIVGTGGVTDGRTITETDIVNYAGLTGDFNPQYVDAEFAKQSIYGERIAHPTLAFSIAYGLWLHAWHRFPLPANKRTAAGHLGDTATFLAPVKIGDTVRNRWNILNNRFSKSRPELGIITFGLQVINQRSEIVIDGSTTMMIGSKVLAAES